MDESLQEMADALVRDPFDHDTRRRYADGLLAADRVDDALGQYRLLARQEPSAAVHAGAARCLVRRGETKDARLEYERARTFADFETDPDLEEALREAPVPRFAVLDGDARRGTAEVTAMASVRPTRFVDIVGMDELKKTIRLRIVEPFLHPGLFARYRKKSGGGILLYGPPGCGKTMIARAIATECNASFHAVGISDILNMWIGESERNLVSLFEKARSERPAVMFFDELDALAYSRSKARSEHTRTLVNEFLNQLDGMDGDNQQVLVLSATNMPWDVDPAMKRPGRFDRQIFVPPPDAAARAEMFRAKLVGVPTGRLDFDALSAACEFASGADIDGIIENAKDEVLGEIVSGGAERDLEQRDLLSAAERAEPSTLDWLRTARNLVKYGGSDRSYRDVEKYLKTVRF